MSSRNVLGVMRPSGGLVVEGAGLEASVSDSVSSSVCWPTTLRRVVWAIWLMAAATFSMATTDLTASTTR